MTPRLKRESSGFATNAVPEAGAPCEIGNGVRTEGAVPEGGAAEMPRAPVSRRAFLRWSGSAAGISAMGGVPLLAPSGVIGAPGRPGAMNRFTVGMIGTGGMGMTHLNNMVRYRTEGKVNIAAVCDVDENHLEPAMNAAGEGWKQGRRNGVRQCVLGRAGAIDP